ncbi:MAG: hypothetical protein V7640_806 [Betaproteobacteria bacterium]
MDHASTEVLYPRLLRRVRAFLIDSVLFIIVIYGWMISLAAYSESPFLLKVLALILPIIIIEPALVAFTGGTPGHHIMGLRIRHASRDENIGILRATVRAIVRTFLGWLSFIFVLVTQRHQALHDYLTSTVVVLRRPETLPAHEKFAVRTEDHAHHLYPSKTRRVMVILLHMLVGVFVFSALGAVLVSEQCATTNRCSPAENVIGHAIGIIWFLCIGATIVLGWRGLLFGCRRSALSQNARADS